jgi:hypothetical protein
MFEGRRVGNLTDWVARNMCVVLNRVQVAAQYARRYVANQ